MKKKSVKTLSTYMKQTHDVNVNEKYLQVNNLYNSQTTTTKKRIPSN